MKKILYPNYDKSIVNLIASILNYYSITSEYKPLDLLSSKLNKHYKNIILMVFDGLGNEIINKVLSPESFLVSNTKTTLTSVFPSTTTAAMTSYYSGISPNEHGWIGWSLYFKECSRIIDTYLNKDSLSGEDIGEPYLPNELMPYETIFYKIKEKNPNILIHTLQPKHINFPSNGNVNIGVSSLEDIVSNVSNICKNSDKNFIFSYWDNPDSIMHTAGCYSKESTDYINHIDNSLLTLSSQLTDTLLIVSADHGQTMITNNYYLNDYPELMDCMYMPPSIESQAISLFIKHEKEKNFKKTFKRLFGNEFILISRKNFFHKHLLGFGIMNYKVSDFVGNYIAIGIGNSILRCKSLNTKNKPNKVFLGHHAGLTTEEMLIPLVIKEI
ncbi:MAG: nucleotide pyrophosphatase [Treponema sp.]|nr:nucleotide pyrophosphatase [Treponema sp.]